MSRYESLRQNEQNILRRTRTFLLEKKYVISEKGEKKKKVLVKNDPITESWNKLDSSQRTEIFETIPLIYALSKKDPKNIKLADMESILSEDRNWSSFGKKWLLDLFKLIKKRKNSEVLYQSFVDNIIRTVILPNAPTMKSLNNNLPISDFIHGDMKGTDGFYSILKKNGHMSTGSKEFTADVILFWGNKNAGRQFLDGKLPLKSIKVKSGSKILIDIDGKTSMACVSLKALDGRVGKIGKFLVTKYGDGTEEIESISDTQNESIELSENWVTDTISKIKEIPSKIVDKIKSLYENFKNWATEFYDGIKKIFNPSGATVSTAKKESDEMKNESEELIKEFDNMLSEHIQSNGLILKEASDKMKIQVPITSCFGEKLNKWYSKFNGDISSFNTSFLELKSKTQSYSSTVNLKIVFRDIDTESTDFKSNTDKIIKFFGKDLPSAMKSPGEKVKQTSKCKYLMVGNQPFSISKEDLKPMLFIDANLKSIPILNNMINDLVKESVDTPKGISNLISFASQLTGEAIFGGAYNIPLVKYDGKEVVHILGTRKEYEKQNTQKLIKYFKDNKTLPVVAIKIYPPKSKTGGVSPYYSIMLYTLADYREEELESGTPDERPIEEKLYYNEIAFKCNKGSDFAFTIESDTQSNAAKLVKSIKVTQQLESDVLIEPS